jgi:hypothetical protein
MFLLPVWRSGMATIAILWLAIACVRVSHGEENSPEIDPTADKRLQAMSE